MSGGVMYGKCDICGKEANLTRKYYKYGIKCECHSPEHFEIVEHCSECTPVAPDRTAITIKPIESKKSHIDRMNDEFDELNDKITKAMEFLGNETKSPKFTDDIQRSFLEQQIEYMVGYREILRDRIEYDSKKMEESK